MSASTSRPPVVPAPGASPGPVLLALVLALAPACVREPPRPRNVLLVTIDTLRADALGCYGRVDAATPSLDALAARGERFETARTQAVVTLPAHASLLSGRIPPAHGVRDNAGFRLGPDVPTLATVLKQRGFATGAFVSAFPLASRFGLARGFDVYDDRVSASDDAGLHVEERPGTATVAAALSWIRGHGRGPFFAWVHVYEPHFPYVPPEPFAARFPADPYAGEVAAADAALRPLLEPYLTASAAAEDTLVVVTADHGEALGEHGEATHGLFAYEATLRVPLILAGPGFLPGSRSDPARHIDVLPTILAAVDAPRPAGVDGRDLRAPVEPEPSYFEALSASRNRGWAPLTGLVHGRLKFVDLPIPELYDLGTDPHELTNLADARPADVAALRRRLAQVPGREDAHETLRPDAETRERLGALGYLSRPVPSAETSLATPDRDPKRLVGDDQALQAAAGRFEAGDLEGARALARALTARAPGMAIAWLHLGYFERAAGDQPAAVAAVRRAVALAPDDDGALGLLGAYLNEAGRPEETARLLSARSARPDADPDVLNAWAIALAQIGRTAEAESAFDRLLALDPSNAEARANRGTVRLMRGDRAGARADLEAALARAPDLRRAQNALGVLAAEAGDRAAAIAHWQAAARGDRSDPDTLFNLGRLLVAEGRGAEARPYLERFLKEAPARTPPADLARVRAWLAES